MTVTLNRWGRPARQEATTVYLAALLDCLDDGAAPSQQALAVRTGLTERSIRRVEHLLEAAGVLTVVRPPGLLRTLTADRADLEAYLAVLCDPVGET